MHDYLFLTLVTGWIICWTGSLDLVARTLVPTAGKQFSESGGFTVLSLARGVWVGPDLSGYRYDPDRSKDRHLIARFTIPTHLNLRIHLSILEGCWIIRTLLRDYKIETFWYVLTELPWPWPTLVSTSISLPPLVALQSVWSKTCK